MAPLFNIAVPLLAVCQYQVSPEDGAPVRVIVTPTFEHCGEFEVGLAGAAGAAVTVIVMPADVTGFGDGQVALEVS